VWFTAQTHNDGHKLQGPFTVTLAVKNLGARTRGLE